jgi:hypothetical protein
MTLRQEIDGDIKNSIDGDWNREELVNTILLSFLKHLPEKKEENPYWDYVSQTLPHDAWMAGNKKGFDLGWNSYRNEIEGKLNGRKN